MEDDKPLFETIQNKAQNEPVLEYCNKYSLNPELPKYFCGDSDAFQIGDWQRLPDDRYIQPHFSKTSITKSSLATLDKISENPKIIVSDEHADYNIVPSSPASSVASNRKFEWDNGADIGYSNVVHRTLQKSISLPILNKFEYKKLQETLGQTSFCERIVEAIPNPAQRSNSNGSSGDVEAESGFLPITSSSSCSDLFQGRVSSSSSPIQPSRDSNSADIIGAPVAESTPFSLQKNPCSKTNDSDKEGAHHTFNVDINMVDKVSHYKHYKMLKLSTSKPVVVECHCNIDALKNVESKFIQTSLVRNVSIGLQTDSGVFVEKVLKPKCYEQQQTVFYMYHSDSDRNFSSCSAQTDNSEMLSNNCQSFEFLCGDVLNDIDANPKSDLTSLPPFSDSTSSLSQQPSNSSSSPSPLAQLLSSRKSNRIPDFQKKVQLLQKMLGSNKYNESTKKFYLKNALKEMFDTRYSDDTTCDYNPTEINTPPKPLRHNRHKNLQVQTFSNEILPREAVMDHFVPIQKVRRSRNHLLTLTNNDVNSAMNKDETTSLSNTEAPVVSPSNLTSTSQASSTKTWRDNKTRSEQMLEEIGNGDSAQQKSRNGYEEDLTWINKEIVHLNKLKRKLKQNKAVKDPIEAVLHKPHAEDLSGLKQSTNVYVLTTDNICDSCHKCRLLTCTNLQGFRRMRETTGRVCRCTCHLPRSRYQQFDNNSRPNIQAGCTGQSFPLAPEYQRNPPSSSYTPRGFDQTETHLSGIESTQRFIPPTETKFKDLGFSSTARKRPHSARTESLLSREVTAPPSTSTHQSSTYIKTEQVNSKVFGDVAAPPLTSSHQSSTYIRTEPMNSRVLGVQPVALPSTSTQQFSSFIRIKPGDSRVLRGATATSSSTQSSKQPEGVPESLNSIYRIQSRTTEKARQLSEFVTTTEKFSLPSDEQRFFVEPRSPKTSPPTHYLNRINEDTEPVEFPSAPFTVETSRSSASKSSVNSYTVEVPMKSTTNEETACQCPCITHKSKHRLVQQLVSTGSIQGNVVGSKSSDRKVRSWINISEDVAKQCTCCPACLIHVGIRMGVDKNYKTSDKKSTESLTENSLQKDPFNINKASRVSSNLITRSTSSGFSKTDVDKRIEGDKSYKTGDKKSVEILIENSLRGDPSNTGNKASRASSRSTLSGISKTEVDKRTESDTNYKTSVKKSTEILIENPLRNDPSNINKASGASSNLITITTSSGISKTGISKRVGGDASYKTSDEKSTQSLIGNSPRKDPSNRASSNLITRSTSSGISKTVISKRVGGDASYKTSEEKSTQSSIENSRHGHIVDLFNNGNEARMASSNVIKGLAATGISNIDEVKKVGSERNYKDSEQKLPIEGYFKEGSSSNGNKAQRASSRSLTGSTASVNKSDAQSQTSTPQEGGVSPQMNSKEQSEQEKSDTSNNKEKDNASGDVPYWKKRDKRTQTSSPPVKLSSQRSTSTTNSSTDSSVNSRIAEICIPITCKCCNQQVDISSAPKDNTKYVFCPPCYNQNGQTSYYAYPGRVCQCHIQSTQILRDVRDTVQELNMLEKSNYCDCRNSATRQNSDYCMRCRCKIKDKHKKGIAYMLTLEPDVKKHKKSKKQRKHSLEEIKLKVPNHNNNRHNSEESTSSNDDKENSAKKKHKHDRKKKSSKKQTLQDYLFVNKPDFITSAEQRRLCLIDLAYVREQRCLKYKEILGVLADVCFKNGVPFHNLSPNKQTSQTKHLFTAAEMKQITAKHYKKLPEVQEKLTVCRDVQVKKANKLLTNIFNQKLRQQTLRGKLTIPTTTSIIKLD